MKYYITYLVVRYYNCITGGFAWNNRDNEKQYHLSYAAIIYTFTIEPQNKTHKTWLTNGMSVRKIKASEKEFQSSHWKDHLLTKSSNEVFVHSQL